MTRAKHIILVILSSLMILSIAISMVILTGSLSYRLFLTGQNLAAEVGLTSQQLVLNFDHLMSYLIIPWQEVLAFPDFSSSANGLQHFIEVKRLMQWNFILSVIGLIFLIVVVKKMPIKERWAYHQWLKLAVYAPWGLLLVIALAFDQLFVLFHQVFFRNDLWLFNPATDPIIHVLPQSLFMLYFVLVLIFYEIIIFIYRQLLKK